jgi:hypothetical protein
MYEYHLEIEFEIKSLKALPRRTDTLTPIALGALKVEIIQHECSATTKDHPK